MADDMNKTGSTPDDGIKIPVNSEPVDDIPPHDPNLRSEQEVDELVRDYERKYSGFREQESEKVKDTWGSWKAKVGHFQADFRPTATSATTTEEERLWAAIAHGSALVTLLIGLPTFGLTTLVTIFIPLGIYLAYRQRSEFVAHQALQAFAMQVIGTVGFVFVLVGTLIAAALVMVLLAITIVGIIVIPFVAIAVVLVVVALLALPLSMTVLGVIGAWETYQGRFFRYPYIANWIDQQTHGGFLSHI